MAEFDVRRFSRNLDRGHGGRLGIAYHDHGEGWVELALPWSAEQVGDPASGTIAAGPVMTLMDMATSIAVWAKRDRFAPHATLDLRLDHLRPPRTGGTLIGRGECYRLTPSVAFVRGAAHDGDPADPVAQMAGTFMLMDAA